MWVDWDKHRPPNEVKGQNESPDVQTITSNGLLTSAHWNFRVGATKSFGEFDFPISAELQEYQGDQDKSIQPIDVPLAVVRVIPGPTWQEAFWNYTEHISTVIWILVLILEYIILKYRLHVQFRTFLSKKYGATINGINKVIRNG